MTIERTTGTSHAESTYDPFAGAEAALAGDHEAAAALMLLRMGTEAKRDSRERADAEAAHMKALQNERLDEMRKQANRKLAASVCSGVGQVVGGSIQLAGATSSDEALTAGGKLAEAGGEAGAAGFAFGADAADRTATRAEDAIAASDRRLEQSDGATRDAQGLVRTAMDFLQGVTDNHDATNQAALRNRI